MIECNKCGGFYFESESMNTLTRDRLKTISNYSNYTNEDWDCMNPNLRANTKALLRDAKNGVKEALGSEELCSCIKDKPFNFDPNEIKIRDKVDLPWGYTDRFWNINKY
jgi:hypothetical protein